MDEYKKRSKRSPTDKDTRQTSAENPVDANGAQEETKETEEAHVRTKTPIGRTKKPEPEEFSFEQLKNLLPPGGIGGFYKEQLKRYFGENGLDENEATRNVIEAIICSRMPPLVTELVYLSQVEKAEIEKILEKISGLLPCRKDNRVYIFHKSFSDWLTGNGYDRSKKDDSGFKIDLGSARQLHCRFAIACATSLINSKLKDSSYESDKWALQVLGNNNLLDDECPKTFSLEQAFSSILYYLVGANLEETAFAVLCSMSFFDSRINNLKAFSSELESLKPALKCFEVDLLLETLKYVRESVGYQRLECKPAEFYEILWQIRLPNNRDELNESFIKLLNDAQNRAKSELIFLINSKLKDSIYESDKLALRKLGDNNLLNDKCQINFSLEQAFSSILNHLIGTNLQETDQETAFAVLCSMSFFDCRINDLKALSSELESLKPALKCSEVDLLLEALQYARKSVGYQRLECKPAEFYEILWQIRLPNNRDELNESFNKLLNDARNRAKSELIFSRKDYTPEGGHTSALKNIKSFQVGDNVRLASCSNDETIRIWNPSDGKYLHTLRGHTGSVNNIIAFQVGDNVRLASCSHDKTIRIWDPSDDYKLLHTLEGHIGSVYKIMSFQVGNNVQLASCSRDKTTNNMIWDPINGKLLHTLEGITGLAKKIIAFQVGDNVRLASCSYYDSGIRIWNPINGKYLHNLRGHADQVHNIIAFQVGDNVRLASCSADTTIQILDPSLGYKLLYTLKGHTDVVRNIIAFQVGDNVRLASCSHDTTIKIWDPSDDYKLLYTLQGHTSWVENIMAFQVGDNVRLASFSELDKTVRIWDPTKNDDAILIITLREKATAFTIIPAPENNERDVLAVGFENGEVLFWESPETTEKYSTSQNN